MYINVVQMNINNSRAELFAERNRRSRAEEEASAARDAAAVLRAELNATRARLHARRDADCGTDAAVILDYFFF